MNITWNLPGQLCDKGQVQLGHQCGHPSAIIEPERLSRPAPCERKVLRWDASDIEDLQCLRVCSIRVEGGAKRMEVASGRVVSNNQPRWCQSLHMPADDLEKRLLLVVVGLTLATEFGLFVEYDGFDAL